MGCAHCGFVNDDDDRFCGGCGQDIQAAVAEAAPSAAASADVSSGAATPTLQPSAKSTGQPEGDARVLGYALDEVLAEAEGDPDADVTPLGGHPVHMEQSELDELFEQ